MNKSLLIAIIATAPLVCAQMGRGGMGSSGSNSQSGSYMQMFSNGGGMVGAGMGFGMAGDFTVAPDGTMYIVRVTGTPAQSSSTGSWQYELLAISPVNGGTLWKLQLPGGRISQPVLSTTSDGLIFITVDDFFSMGIGRMAWTQPDANSAKLLMITHTASSASIASTITPGAGALSEPSIVADPAGGYLIAVIGYDLPAAAQFSTTPPTKTLYAYKPNGSLKFSVKLPAN
ncbi:MAG: hypothetical protein LAO79_06470 [Acidobacteriia bacterium]|nr:hypothetical protein [Terriglobia bacterium]